MIWWKMEQKESYSPTRQFEDLYILKPSKMPEDIAKIFSSTKNAWKKKKYSLFLLSSNRCKWPLRRLPQSIYLFIYPCDRNNKICPISLTIIYQWMKTTNTLMHSQRKWQNWNSSSLGIIQNFKFLIVALDQRFTDADMMWIVLVNVVICYALAHCTLEH